MNDAYFDNVNNIGKLYIEYVFYEFESEPILFTCVDEKQDLYLCLCCEIRYKQRWIIIRCNIALLKSLVKEELDVASVFLSAANIIAIDMDINGEEKSSFISQNEIDRLDLPEDGTYLKCNTVYALNYLWNKEWKSIYQSLRKAMDIYPIRTETVHSYSAALNDTTKILAKQLDVYNNSINKMLKRHYDQLNKTLQTSMVKQSAYSINVKEKYVEVLDQIEVRENADNSYIEAA